MEIESKETEFIPVTNRQKMVSAIEEIKSWVLITIATDEEFEKASHYRRQVSTTISELEKEKKELTEPYKSKSKFIDAEYKKVIDIAENGFKVLGNALSSYQQAKHKKEREEQARIEAENREKTRKAQEALDKAREFAAELEAQGNTKLAEKILTKAENKVESAATQIVAPVAIPTKPEGTSFREKWVCTVTDKNAAIFFMLQIPMLNDFITIDTVGLTKAQNSMGGKIVVDGITWNKELIPVSKKI
ncbi:MAG: hypothetical protein EHM12_11250 [Dehalococcoidia bacterium]|nr:MAG: hypothetical protein EHM12_11250 [Dehalococcoidia bacterium]